MAPVFLGIGIRLFEGIDKDKYDLQIIEVIPSDLYNIINKPKDDVEIKINDKKLYKYRYLTIK